MFLPLLAVPRCPRAALVGGSRGTSVGSVSGASRELGRAGLGRRWEEHARQLTPLLSAAVCEGNSTCSENEVCVRPGECRCRHGYFGANCDTSERGAGRDGYWAAGQEIGEMGGASARRRVPGGANSLDVGVEGVLPAQTTEPRIPWSLQSVRASSGVPTARSGVVATRTGSVRT